MDWTGRILRSIGLLVVVGGLVWLTAPSSARERTLTERVAVLEGQVAALNGDVAELKAAKKALLDPAGCIKEYWVDSTAGKIKCRSCRFEDEK